MYCSGVMQESKTDRETEREKKGWITLHHATKIIWQRGMLRWLCTGANEGQVFRQEKSQLMS